jgi:hypothetical protein
MDLARTVLAKYLTVSPRIPCYTTLYELIHNFCNRSGGRDDNCADDHEEK